MPSGPFRAREKAPESLPFKGTTTNKVDFDKKPLSRREPYAPKRELPPDVKFDGNTTYTNTFDKKEIGVRYVR